MIREILYFGIRSVLFLGLTFLWVVVLGGRPAPKDVIEKVADQVEGLTGLQVPALPTEDPPTE